MKCGVKVTLKNRNICLLSLHALHRHVKCIMAVQLISFNAVSTPGDQEHTSSVCSYRIKRNNIRWMNKIVTVSLRLEQSLIHIILIRILCTIGFKEDLVSGKRKF